MLSFDFSSMITDAFTYVNALLPAFTPMVALYLGIGFLVLIVGLLLGIVAFMRKGIKI